MKILVTGTEGYIGTRLAPLLAAAGHEVTGLDTGLYRDGCLYTDPVGMPVGPRTIFKDLRTVTPRDFEGFDAVIHLAELSNDPLGQNRPEITFKINHEGSVRIANAARAAGVSRFVYASSCSVYGIGSGELLDETSPTHPQTAYAECKVRVERDLLPMASERFSVVFLRNATAYGPSPRMRFDIVLNDLCALAHTRGKIAMISDGSPWRPIVHIEDICAAMRCAVEAPSEAVNGEIFNVGRTDENYRVREIAKIVADRFPGCEVTVGPPSQDNRSYRVSFEKIAARLPGFVARWTAAKGAEEMARLFARIEMSPDTHEFRAFTRLKQLKYLLRTRQIDDDLFWSPPVIFETTPLQGALVIRPERRDDERGFFARTWCHDEFAAHGIAIEMVQASVSHNRKAGTVRGLHFARPPANEAKLVRCERGRIFDVIVDLRPQSPSYLKHVVALLDEEGGAALYVPAGVAHGFQTLADDSTVSYLMSETYRAELADGVRFDDKAFGIRWPAPVSVIAERDRGYPDFDAGRHAARFDPARLEAIE